MEFTQVTKQIVDLQKMSLNNWYAAVCLVQDQATSTMGMMLDQATWLPQDGRQAIQSWLSFCRDERDRLKSYMDTGVAGLEKTFVQVHT